MFTGIIEEVGNVKSLQFQNETASIEIEAVRVLESLQLGDSIAVNGVCLTVRTRTAGEFKAELSEETLVRSNFRQMQPGSRVNLERPLLASGRLGGHFVQGHADAIATVKSITRTASRFALYEFSLPVSVERYVVEKGSITVDGISLTVSQRAKDSFQTAIVPHTLENTNLDGRRVGDLVNLECDVLAKYVESVLKAQTQPVSKSTLTLEYLRERGY